MCNCVIIETCSRFYLIMKNDRKLSAILMSPNYVHVIYYMLKSCSEKVLRAIELRSR